MSDAELTALETMIRLPDNFTSMPLDQLRAAVDEFGDLTLPDPAVRLVSETIGGVPVEIAIAPGARADRSVVYLHGGAAAGSLRSHRGMVAMIAQAAGVRMIAVDFRRPPEAPFPSAHDDVVAVYRALIEGGTDPSTIAFAGDSCGGGLVLVTLVRIRDEGLPMPVAAAVISPWTDLTSGGQSMTDNRTRDVMVSREISQMMADYWLSGTDPRDPRASALYADLTGLPPLFIQAGSREVMLDDSVRIARRAADYDVEVVLEIGAKMPHVWHQFAGQLSEGREAIGRMGAFLKERLS